MIYDQIFEVGPIQNGDLRYVIQSRMIGPHQYLQRHIWLAAPYRTTPSADEWIPSLKCVFEGIVFRGTEVAEPDRWTA